MSRTFRLVKQTPIDYDGEDALTAVEAMAVEVTAEDEDRLPWYPVIVVEKYRSQEDYDAGHRFDVVRRVGNLLTNVGGNRVVSKLIGAAGTALDAANAKIAVGDSSTAAAVGQTALVGTNTLSKAMDGGFPSVSGRIATFKSSFTGGEANFEWREWGLFAGTDLINRKTGTFGIKLSGAIWVATATITI